MNWKEGWRWDRGSCELQEDLGTERIHSSRNSLTAISKPKLITWRAPEED